MSKQLTNEQLEMIAKELDIPVNYVQDVYSRSLEKGNPFLQTGKEQVELEESLKAAVPAALGGANTGDHDNNIVPATTEVPTTEVPTTEVPTTEVTGIMLKEESLELYDALMDLDEEEYKEFLNVALVVKNKRESEKLELEETGKEKKSDMKKKGDMKNMEDEESMADEEEDMTEEEMKKAEKSAEFVALKEQVEAQAQILNTLAEGMALLLKQKEAKAADVPREQAVLPEAETADSDEAILAALKEAEKKAPAKAAKFPMYDQFTSKRLNQGR